MSILDATSFKESLLSLDVDFQEKKYLLAFSGGVDSVVLFHLLKALKLDFSVAHINYNLRGEESLQDEAFVKEIAEKNSIPYYIKAIETQNIKPSQQSLQMFCRAIRYAYFEKLQKEFGFDYILTAHHQNDVIETFFINALRANGIQGLSSIPTKNNSLIRPLLPFSKNEIEKYAKENQLNWREDKTNQESTYQRNFLRNEIIPKLSEKFPNAEKNIGTSIAFLSEIHDYIENQIAEEKQNNFKPYKKGIYVPKSMVQNRYDFEYLWLFQEYGFNSLDEIKKFLIAETGSQFSSASHYLYVDREGLYIFRIGTIPEAIAEIEIKSLPFHLQSPFHLKIENSPQAHPGADISLDADTIRFPLKIRSKKVGDTFNPNGLNGSKKLSKFFKDEKIPTFEKNSIPILVDAQDIIITVLGYRWDRRFEINPQTNNYLNIFL